MRAFCILLCVLGWCAVAMAQLTPEEAYEKLKEREKERAAAATQPAEPAPNAPPKVSGIEIGRLIHKGWEDLLDHHYEDAIKSFDKAILASSNDAVALEGRGICKYEIKEYKPADKDTLKAYNLSSFGGAQVSRQLVIAAAATALMNDNAMRSAKIIRDLMQAEDRNGKLDEELQNDLGISLTHVSAQAKQLPAFQEALKYYEEYDKKLDEQKHEGEARWGTKWIGKKEAEEKWNDYKHAAEEVQKLDKIADHAHAAVIQAFSNYTEIQGGLRLHGTAEIQQYTMEYKQSLANQAAAQKALARAEEHFNHVDKPPFPELIQHDWEEPR